MVTKSLFQKLQLKFWVIMKMGSRQVFISHLLILFTLAQISTPERCHAKPDAE